MELVSIILAEIIIIIILIVGLIVLNKTIQEFTLELSNKRRLDELTINLNHVINKEELHILDDMIEECLNEYKILHFEFEENLYITEEIAAEMERNVLKKVLTQISPIFYSKLKYIYNENIIENYILTKIRFSILDYKIEVNGNYKE